jgi:RNA polymerase sigma-B factor
VLGRDDDGYALAERREMISGIWQSLSDLERQVIALRFVHGMTQREIGQRIGYSQMHVSRLLRRSLSQLLAAPAPDA